MQEDIDHSYRQYLDHSHHGHPSVIETTHTGQRGRPAYHIDPAFLQWAYSTRSISSISRFLGISSRSVRNALLAYGLAEPQISPFIGQESSINQNDPNTQQTNHNFILDPLLPSPDQPALHQECVTSFTGPLSF